MPPWLKKNKTIMVHYIPETESNFNLSVQILNQMKLFSLFQIGSWSNGTKGQDLVRRKRKLLLPFTDIITASKYTSSEEKAEISSKSSRGNY